MPHGVCKLCLQMEGTPGQPLHPKGNVQISPNSLGEKPKSRGGRRTRESTTSKQVKDFLLCAKCEDLFNKNGENEILKWVWNGKSFPLGDRLAVAVPLSLDPSVTPSFSGTSIGVDTEKICVFRTKRYLACGCFTSGICHLAARPIYSTSALRRPN